MSARRRRLQAGYTLLEVLAAMAVLGTGMLGIISLQGAAVTANRRANEVTSATNIARLWQERLRRDSFQWNFPSVYNPVGNLSNTWYLKEVTTNSGAWFIPSHSTPVGGPLETAAFDYWGRDVDITSANAHYCAHIRLTNLIPNELVRAEVRVFWYREGGVRNPVYVNCASSAPDDPALGQDTTTLHWVYMTQTLARHEL